MTVSGTLTAREVELRIGGTAAAHGALRVGPAKSLNGTLGGEHVHVTGGEPQAAGAQIARFRDRYR